jgi:nucleotide-binding universal stress UspA family protein
MNQSIVCGIDDSYVSQSAARVAARLARQLGDKLVLAHVAHDPPPFPYGDTRLRELRRHDLIRDATAMLERVAATLPGIVPEIKVLFGDAVEALTLSSQREDTELLVVGSRGRRPIAAAILGSVSAGLANAAHCPVVVVSSSAAAQRFLARTPGGHVVCALDDTRSALDGDAGAIVVGSDGRGTRHAGPLGPMSDALANGPPVAVVVVPPTARVTRLAENVAEATVQEVLRATAHPTQQAVVNGPRRPKRTVEHRRTGRFSEGLEQLPQTPNKLRHGRFSDGIEDLPVTPDGLHRGRFSSGIERLPHSAATLRRGSFADGYSDDVPAPRSKAA